MYSFKALTPAFSPTFKRIRGKCLDATPEEKQRDDFDIRSFYDPKRLPSYTDRILFRSSPGFKGDIKVGSLHVCEWTDSSDHKPVFANFRVKIRKGARGILVPNALKYLKREIENSPLGKPAKLHGQNNFTKVIISKLKATDLSEMDLALFGGKSDPFIKVTLDPPEVCVALLFFSYNYSIVL